MKRFAAALLAVGLIAWLISDAQAQTPGEVFRTVAPSVVVIRAKGRDISTSGQTSFAETGSGVLISADGKVMTAAHVVHAMDEISVEFLGGETVKARVVASEPAADLSLLQLERVPAEAKSSPLANSDSIQVGDPVIIVDAPYGLSYSLSNGLISARWKPNTVDKTMPLAEFFQTTATINTDNSGGPMFSMNGEVIGIVSHPSLPPLLEMFGFVVTINTAKTLLLERKSFWAGLEGRLLTDREADLLNLPPGATGYIIKTVAKDSPGEQIGLRGATLVVNLGSGDVPLGGDDIILSIEGIKAEPANLGKVRDLLATRPPGSSFKVTIFRAGKVVELTGRVP